MKTNELETLLGRYYDGLTTRDEELRLRQLLTDNDSRRHDADRAVMGLIEGKRRSDRNSKRKGRTFTRVAAMLAVVLCLGAAAATITYRVVVEREAAPKFAENSEHSDPSEFSEISEFSENSENVNLSEPSDSLITPGEPRLAEDLVFQNQSLAEIASQLSAVFGCRVEFTDEQSAELRLYLTLPKGSTASRFVETIDAYDALQATLKDNTVTIKMQEGER